MTLQLPWRRSALAMVFAMAFATAAVADDKPAGQTVTDPAADRTLTSETSLHYAGEYHGCRSQSIIGKSVQDSAGKDIGQIKDLAVDPDSGRVAYGVLSFGGFMGIGDKLFAIPWRSLEFLEGGENDGKVQLDVTKEQLERAQGFDESNWPNMADERWARTTHTTFNQRPYWETDYSPTRQMDAATTQAETHGQTGNDDMADEVMARDEQPSPVSERIVRLSKLLDTKVMNSQNEKLGAIEDAVIDTGQGQIAFVVLASGGFLEIGEDLAAVPYDSLNVQGEDQIVLNVDKQKLTAAPRIAKNNWPDESDKSYVVRLYRYYGADPYWQDYNRRVSSSR